MHLSINNDEIFSHSLSDKDAEKYFNPSKETKVEASYQKKQEINCAEELRKSLH